MNEIAPAGATIVASPPLLRPYHCCVPDGTNWMGIFHLYYTIARATNQSDNYTINKT